MIKIGIDEGCRLLTGGLGKPAGLDVGWYANQPFSVMQIIICA